jgi:hypothetical protein
MAGMLMGAVVRARAGWCVILVLSCASFLASAAAPVARGSSAKPGGFIVDVVFEDASQTAGLAKHAYILLIEGSGSNPLTYKTEAVGAGERDLVGIPTGMLARPPFRVSYQQQSARAKGAYDVRLATSRSLDYYMHSFARTAARVNRAHIVYQVLGDNSNRYAYSALVWAGLRPPTTNPPLLWVPGWGQTFSCLCMHECAAA